MYQDVSDKEANAILKALKDPKFASMFRDYAQEISDPKAKAEQEAYLRQLETEGRAEEVYGRGARLVVPQPALVLKTHGMAGAPKVFINVCTNEKIDPPKRLPREGGCLLEIPHCLGRKPAEGFDSKGAAAHAWDFVVHPLAVDEAARFPGVLKNLVDVAKEGVAKASGMELSGQHKLIKSKYKSLGGALGPTTMALCPEGAAPKGAGSSRVKPMPAAQSRPFGSAPYSGTMPAAGSRDAPPRHGPTADADAHGGRSAFSFSSRAPVGNASGTAMSADEHAMATAHVVCAGGPTVPRWKLVHSFTQDLADAWSDARYHGAAQQRLPRELVLQVDLPGLTGIHDIRLHVGRSAVFLAAGAGRYALEVRLPHAVDTNRSRARFDAHLQQLTAKLPVLPVRSASPPCQGPGGDPAATAASHPAADQDETTVARGSSSPPACLDGGSIDGVGSPASGQPQAEVQALAVAVNTAHKTLNELLWEQLHGAGCVTGDEATQAPLAAQSPEGVQTLSAVAQAPVPAPAARVRAGMPPRILASFVDELV